MDFYQRHWYLFFKDNLWIMWHHPSYFFVI